MVSGITVGVLKELHADHIVLSDSSCIPLSEGLAVDQIAPGSRITIVYSRNDDGEGMVVQSIKQSMSIEEFPYLPTLPSATYVGVTDLGRLNPSGSR